MKLPLIATTGGLLCLAAAPVFDTLRFGPEEGTVVTKSFETTFDVALDDMMVTFNGQDMDPAMMGMDLTEASMSATILVEVEDEYGPTADGRPATLTRRFETLSADFEAGNGESKSENDEDLEGATLVFTWDEEESAYRLETDDEDLDLDELSHGAEDMDLRALLPAGDVEEGASWRIAGFELLSVMWPGVDWPKAEAKLREEMDENDVPFDVDEIFGDLMREIDLRCTYDGLREVEGRELQVVELFGELEHSMELGEAILEMIRAEAPAEVEMELMVDVELAAELTGELLWDSESGHFYQCNMDLELAFLANVETEADIQGNPMSGTAEVEASGILRRRASAR